MKLGYKVSGVMALLGLGILIVVMVVFSLQNNQQAINSRLVTLSTLSEQVAQDIGSRLVEKSAISIAFASSPSISDALLKSNREFARLSEGERGARIKLLNEQWRATPDINDPFVQPYLSNPLATYLKLQQNNMPGLYGEIFLTNRYGVMVASTGKLTTLAHGHKYWWLEAYDRGQGKIFFDDRGFDESVRGYVVGIVVPIKVNNEIVGILKSNINVLGLLKEVIDSYSQSNFGKLQIVRSGGLIVAAEGVTPLSTQLPEYAMQQLSREMGTALQQEGKDSAELFTASPIRVTMGTEMYGFGGAAKSNGHSLGNVGEGWHVVISLSEDEALVSARDTTEAIVLVSVIFITFIVIASLSFGKVIAHPLVILADKAKKIGYGDFDIQMDIDSRDEIGSLASSFNKMVVNLKATMISRDALIDETEERKGLNQLLLESVADGIFGLDINGKVTFINPAACLMLGYSAEDVLNSPICSMISKEQSDGFFCRHIACAMAVGINDSDPHHASIETLWRKDGSSFSAEYNTTCIKRGDELIGAVVTFRDITEREKSAKKSALLQRQLQQSQKMDAIGKLTGGVAHDFNNMLSAILGYSNLAIDLCGDGKPGEKLGRYITEIIKAGERSRDLVAQMLAFSRGDMGEIRQVELNQLVKDVLKMLRATIPSSIELKCSVPEHAIYVETDAVQLHQVVLNLVINARDALQSESGMIEVGVTEKHIGRGYCDSCHGDYSGNYAALYVTDTGSGISEAVIQNIFEPFFTTKEVGKGTGMGLAMVHGIVHASNGHIQLQSQEGKGTTISLNFPAVLPEADREVEVSQDQAEENSAIRGHILVVDDEPQLTALIQVQLLEAGYDVTLSADPLQVLEWFQRSPDKFDLVITDQTMPGMTGDVLARQLLAIRSDIPIILSTGFSSSVNREQARAIGIRRFMDKPLSKELLLQAISELLASETAD